MKSALLPLIGGLGFWMAGCASPAPSALNYSMVRIESASRADVMLAARQAVQEHFDVARFDPAAGIVEGHPAQTQEPGTTGRLGDVLGAQRRVRRVAEVRVEEAGTGIKVFCKVLVEQSEGDERGLYAYERDVSDLPTDTPAQREAATLPEQNASWRTQGRDKELERQILRAVTEQTGPA